MKSATFDEPDWPVATPQVGDQVKLRTNTEGFWVLVEQAYEGRFFVGLVDNGFKGGRELKRTAEHGLTLGDRVRFTLRHVHDVIPPTGSPTNGPEAA